MANINRFKWIIFLVVFYMLMRGEAFAAKLDWYITPGLSYISPDPDRDAHGSVGFQIGIGAPVGKLTHLEFTAMANTLPQESHPSQGSSLLEFEQRGWLLDGLYFFQHRPQYSAYGIFGAGTLRTEFNTQKRYRSVLNVGVGAMSQKLWTTDRVGIRTDLRYRIDESNLLGQNRFGDWVINVTLFVPLSRNKAMTPSDLISDPVKTGKSKSRVLSDRDGDGVPDPNDACPSTPKSGPVDESGCEVMQDSDGDGVPNVNDACPSTPSGDPVNESGCERDTDNDGVLDSKDLCPDTPLDASIDKTGCETKVEQKSEIADGGGDTDGDGIADAGDLCPVTASGAVVNATGCELDKDGDQIVDRLDQCPQSEKDEKVDTSGCKISNLIILKGVNFDVGSDRLLPSATATLDAVSQTLKRYPEIVVEVAGYTDNNSKKGETKALSKKRADAVAKYLVVKGVLAANLIAKGFGSQTPIASNKTAEGRKLNRRVEMHILSQ